MPCAARVPGIADGDAIQKVEIVKRSSACITFAYRRDLDAHGAAHMVIQPHGVRNPTRRLLRIMRSISPLSGIRAEGIFSSGCLLIGHRQVN